MEYISNKMSLLLIQGIFLKKEQVKFLDDFSCEQFSVRDDHSLCLVPRKDGYILGIEVCGLCLVNNDLFEIDPDNLYTFSSFQEFFKEVEEEFDIQPTKEQFMLYICYNQ